MYRLCVDHESRQNGMELKHLKNRPAAPKRPHKVGIVLPKPVFLRFARAI